MKVVELTAGVTAGDVFLMQFVHAMVLLTMTRQAQNEVVQLLSNAAVALYPAIKTEQPTARQEWLSDSLHSLNVSIELLANVSQKYN